jgi:hypothetical protein
MRDTYDRRSKLAFGFAIIFALSILETLHADRAMPNKASPLIWALLGGASVACAGYALYCRAKARRL